ncbi:PROLACTIN REGULATORY ELEMENT BINDING PROTEIN [Salix koriyanagi]|uniref:PROLACTIN REGULATORY ELEMENT BINDING PROTEIN n=1 Tax=Salix koriyanagi TaxID=2511006 RepID=A0A9Q1AF39_9ROSI|nr:PROLACTIN REGULATORY ELEMENT BINDING PROTEIN [Salix koriyanagi]
MGKKKETDPPALQRYGVPLYSAAWLPPQSRQEDHDSSKQQEQEQDKVREEIPHASASSYEYYVVLAGGGGEGRSGIPNAVLLSRFDFSSNSLSPQPVAKLNLGSDLPYRMVVHPGGDGLICALPNSCRFFEWDEIKDNEAHKFGLKLSEKVLTHLEDVGQQLALVFNSDSSVLAVGGEDGNLRVFKWPSMEIIFNEAQAHVSLKDLCFSPDGKFLVSLGGRGPGRVWDVTSSMAVASLSKENDEIFASCRFSQISDQTQVLYIAAITDKGSSIMTWNTSSWKRVSSKHVFREPVSSFNISPDGKFLAIGTAQGDVLLINSTNMRVQTMIRKAHLGIVTALTFSHDSRALVSASMDSSARVTLVDDKKCAAGGSSLRIIIFIIIMAIAVYFLKNEGVLPFLG